MISSEFEIVSCLQSGQQDIHCSLHRDKALRTINCGHLADCEYSLYIESIIKNESDYFSDW